MPTTNKSRRAHRPIASVIRLVAGIAIGAAVICGGHSEGNANQPALQLIASQDMVPAGQRGVFVRLKDGCPTLEQLLKLISDTAANDRTSYYYDFTGSGCIDAVPGDEGINLEFNFTARASRIRLDRDHQEYWFNTVGADGSLFFITK
jgi:hypothetical protein